MLDNSAWCAVAELAASQHGVFHRTQAARYGLSTHDLREAMKAGWLTQPRRDIYAIATEPPTWHQRLKIADLVGAYVSHRSAAALHRLDGFEPGIVEVSIDRGQERSLAGATIHRWRHTPTIDLVDVDGIRCTTVERTLAQLGAVAARADVERALTAALARGHTFEAIATTALRLYRPGPTGIAVLIDLLVVRASRGPAGP